jgi:hypothetical protein
VGDTAASKSVPAHRTERIVPARSYWASNTAAVAAAAAATAAETETDTDTDTDTNTNTNTKHGNRNTLGDVRGGDAARARGEGEWWVLLIMVLSPSASAVEALRHCQMERAYWETEACLGLGLGAWGGVERVRWQACLSYR